MLRKLMNEDYKPTILVHSKNKQKVYIERSTNVNDQLWESVVFWWDSSISQNDSILEIDANDFLSKSSWLRSRWTKDGGVVKIDEQTRTILKSARQDFEIYKTM